MNDTIYRQAAVDAIEKLRWDRFTRGDYFQVFAVDALEEAALIIEHLPSAQQEQRWIPVSERLPEEEDMYKRPQNRYFCQMNHAGVFLVLARLRHLDSPMAAFWDWYGKRVPDKDVVAWMPLPEPYKGDES